jgi:hypothetical protein
METAIAVLLLIVGAFFGAMFVLFFICRDSRPIAEQLEDIRRHEFAHDPTEHGRVPL